MSKMDKQSKHKDRKDTRIGRLNEELLGHYRKVADFLKDDEEKRDGFIEGIFPQLLTEAVQVSQNQTVSSIIEELLHLSTPKQIHSLLEVFCMDIETVCTDRFASYVMQTAVLLSSQHFKDDEIGEELLSVFEKIYRFFDSQLAVFMQHTYASHILRVIIEILGGERVDQNIVRSRASQSFDKGKKNKKDVKIPAASKQHVTWLKEMASKIVGLGKLKDFAKNYLSNPVLQTVLLVLSKRGDRDTLDKIISALVVNMDMFEINPEKNLPDLACHTIGSRLLEQVVVLAGPDLLNNLYTHNVMGNAVQWSLDGTANYVLQRLLEQPHSRDMFENLFDDLVDSVEGILAEQHLGVILAIADGILKHNTRERPFADALQSAFHCADKGRTLKFVPCMASLNTYEVFYNVPDSDVEQEEEKEEGNTEKSAENGEEKKEKDEDAGKLKSVHYHGSMILQKLVQMNGDIQGFVCGGILALSREELFFLATDKCGSHILEAMLKSPTVITRAKDNLCRKMKGSYVSLATNQCGSRVLDVVWEYAQLKIRLEIGLELLEGGSSLKNNRFGKFVYAKCSLDLLQTKKAEWTEKQKREITKQKSWEKVKETIIKIESRPSKKRKVEAAENSEEMPNKKKQKKEKRQERVLEVSENSEEPSTKKKKKKEKKQERVIQESDNIPAVETEKLKKKKKKKKSKQE